MTIKNTRRRLPTLLLAHLILISLAAVMVPAQTDDLQALRKEVDEIIERNDYLEALPLLEKLVVADPDNAAAHFYLGHALLAKSVTLRDQEAIKRSRVRARGSFIRAKELGSDIEILDAMIQSIPEDGSMPGKYSNIPEAEEAMLQGETAFAGGKYDEALLKYQRALFLDSKIYEAALYSGDMYVQKADYSNAEYWYQRAISMDPNRETAYRYSATPLMLQKKYDEARDRYVESFITEPYSSFAVTGISQWAKVTDKGLGHPVIKIPVVVSDDGKGGYQAIIDKSLLEGVQKNNGSGGWLEYGTTRSAWRKGKFAAAYPTEEVYRHSLQEEAEALRAVIAAAEKSVEKHKGTLESSIFLLKELDGKGFLEAYILLAIPDRGIAQDHASYLREHRDKLREYFMEYVIK